jgi:hypothetical protein
VAAKQQPTLIGGVASRFESDDADANFAAAEDPIGLLPPRLILGINKRGVHFFRPVPKEYLHSAELRDIMQVGP